MKSLKNLRSAANYRELFSEENSLNMSHPAMQKMQELSGSLSASEPTAIARLEVYKECHLLAEDLYRLTGSKKVFVHVLSIGNLLISRLFSSRQQSLQANQ